jgi:type I restriction enzyme S subunit
MMSRLVPKLRFKEFGGEWEEKKIGDFFKTYSGGTPSTTNKKYYGGNIPFNFFIFRLLY